MSNSNTLFVILFYLLQDFPTTSPTTFTCPTPSPGGGTAAPGTECKKVQGTYDCSNCCSEFSSDCKKGNKVVCGLNNDPDNSDCPGN